MQGFFATPQGGQACNTFVVAGKNLGQEKNQELEDGPLGIIISRRPNRRASSEYAPGPRQITAIAITVARAVENRVSNRFGFDAGIQESALPMLVTAATIPVRGVK